MILHPFPPLYDENSRILILGSFPSVRSREQRFFYGHPQNRFWRVLSCLLALPCPETQEEKRSLLLANGIALWDVIGSCEIEGSADASIRNATPNDLRPILAAADIRAVFVNGKTALRYYDRFQRPLLGREAVFLPSTSPANAAMGLTSLTDAWRVILPYLEKGSC